MKIPQKTNDFVENKNVYKITEFSLSQFFSTFLYMIDR